MCFAKSVACLSNAESDDSESDVFTVHGLDVFGVNRVHTNNASDSWFVKIKVQDKLISFKVDSGAQIDVLPLSIVKGLNSKSKEKEFIRTSNIKLKPFIGNCIDVYGECFLNCTYANRSLTSRFAVVDEFIS